MQFQTQLFEIESAITESSQTTKAYKIVGNIMIATDKEALKKELESDARRKTYAMFGQMRMTQGGT